MHELKELQFQNFQYSRVTLNLLYEDDKWHMYLCICRIFCASRSYYNLRKDLI